MTITNQIRSNFPKTIDKSKKVFSAIIANDKEDASIQKQLLDVLNYMSEWTSTPDVYEQNSTMLDKTVSFFSFLERFADETDLSLKNRFRAIFVRNHDKKWGTPFDVKNVFRQYFPHANIYLLENTNKIDSTEPGLANLLLDGDIETDDPTDWTLINCSATKNARFSKTYGIEINQSGGVLSQNVSIESSSTYFLHFFLKGKVSVVIKSDNNKYWDNTNNIWKNTEIENIFSADDWINKDLFFNTESDDSDVTIYFKYAGEIALLDYFQLYKKQNYSSFTVIAHFEGNTSIGAFGLAAGDDDPNNESSETTPPQPRYSNYGYFDKSFLSGVPIGFASDIYEDLLDYLRSQGVRAFFKILIKDA